MKNVQVLAPEGWRDYELVDSGEGKKLERWGQFLTIRPEPRAIWGKSSPNDWEMAGAVFENETWNVKYDLPKKWVVEWKNIRFSLKPTEFKHTGVFPEQAVNWEWIQKSLPVARLPRSPVKVLNLFAYTGGATIAAALTGAHVTHVDASRPAMMWASENAGLSKIPKDRIRWIQDDVLKFVKREIKRGQKYEGIIMDPPRFGRGMKGEVWKLLDDFPELVSACKQILSPAPLFVLINAYTADMSSLVVRYLLENMMKDHGGQIESGELGLPEAASGKILPAGIFARWNKI